jgi:hypothetical protein
MRRPVLDRFIEDGADHCVMLRCGIESIYQCVDIGLVYGRADPCVRRLHDMETREGAMRRMNLNLADSGVENISGPALPRKVAKTTAQ